MNKMEIYEATRSVPEIAKKPIKGGRLSGMTDINPMWRIKTLTEQFGMCGVGWYTEIVNKEIYPVGNEIIVSVDCNLYIKVDDEWSKPICGTGGAKLISNESKGLYNDDEAFKKAETDAISVCCKKLGIGADVYWSKDEWRKYRNKETVAEVAYRMAEIFFLLNDDKKVVTAAEIAWTYGWKTWDGDVIGRINDCRRNNSDIGGQLPPPPKSSTPVAKALFPLNVLPDMLVEGVCECGDVICHCSSFYECTIYIK